LDDAPARYETGGTRHQHARHDTGSIPKRVLALPMPTDCQIRELGNLPLSQIGWTGSSGRVLLHRHIGSRRRPSSLDSINGYTPCMPDGKALSWKAVSFGAGTIAALVTRRALAMLWNQFAEVPAPEHVADRRIPWIHALSWAVATGVGVSVMKLVAQRS